MKSKLISLKTGLLLTSISISVCLSGCGSSSDEEKALADFSSEISDFTDYIKEADTQINSLDATDSSSIDSLLEILDDMDEDFQKLSELDAPSQYQDVENLADEASENMSLAVSCYHSFFESETFSEENADIAYEYYSRAMKRVRYIGYMLAGGEIPEEENVTIYEESNDSSILHKWLSDDENDEIDTSSEAGSEDAQ
ncbi:MAG: hypothetical protein LUE96_06900 [Lachnospiraceae bacterium]|nr:hypothetical protein [Lachnospiraceae bacterium]